MTASQFKDYVKSDGYKTLELSLSSATVTGNLTAATLNIDSLDLSGALTAATADLNGGNIDGAVIRGKFSNYWIFYKFICHHRSIY